MRYLFLILSITAFFKYSNSQSYNTSKAYAIIIGINDYKNIPKLLYAKNDALAFHNLLISKFKVNQENIHLLLDEEANYKNCFNAIYSIAEKIQKYDSLFFFFAGHGDVEAKISANSTLLLLSNSPSTNYFRENEFISISILKDLFYNLSNKGVKTYFICDACRSGVKLIGGVEGSRKTSESLTETWFNEVRFLSCQANELSFESNRIGNGRGVFSFYLEMGLRGLSDDNMDGDITLGEIKRYIEDRVAKNTNEKQNPIIIGDPKRIICQTDALSVKEAKEMEKGVSLSQQVVVNDRGVKPDSIFIIDFYNEMNNKNEFMYVNNQIIEKFQYLLNSENINNIEADLFNYSNIKFQNLIDKYYNSEKIEDLFDYRTNFEDLENFFSLLTPKIRNDYFKNQLITYTRFLNCMNYIFLSTNINSVKYKFYIDDLSYNIKNGHTHPFIYKMLGLLYFRINNYNKAQDMLESYLSLLPNDAYAYNFCGIIISKLNYLEKAISYFKRAIEIKSDYYNPYYNLAVLYNSLHKTDDAKRYFQMAETLRQPDNKYDY